MKMKRKHLLCCLTVAAMLGGCGPESLEKTPQERQTQTADMLRMEKERVGQNGKQVGTRAERKRGKFSVC